MKKYPEDMYIMIRNMIKMHFTYEDMYDLIKTCFPDIEITFEQLLNIIEEQMIKMI